ncbi:MAG TPA: glycosyltransferase family 39 protein [Xanthobacteraceae bacterium]|nr:glycosyltransferase family 39 protein [Xanthobacteraceae bacterium]
MAKFPRSALRAMYSRAMYPFDCLRRALCDRAQRERTAVLLLAVYAGVWTLYDFLSRRSEDIHFDMAEMAAWSRDLALGSAKHPQMGAWIAGLWFSVFPYRDWAFYLLANTLAGFSLWIAWRLSEHRLSDNKRVAGLAFLMLVPFFNFFAWKYNANTILIPLWAVTTFFFVRSLETRSRAFAALAGIAAAAAMMGKYWSIFLLAGLGIAALASPHRRDYFRSFSPWITMAAGALALAPHLYWVATHGFAPVSYALNGHAAHAFSVALKDAALYVGGFAAYLAVPLFLLMLVARPKLFALADTVWPRDGTRRFVAIAFWAPVLLPIPVALLLDTKLASIWTMSALALAPIVFLSSPKIRISAAAAGQALAVAAVFSLCALVIAPARALRVHEAGALNDGEEYKPVARAVDRQWRRTSGTPLAVVAGFGNLANGISFYLRDRPRVLNLKRDERLPWVNEREMLRRGAALVCPLAEPVCVQRVDAIARGRAGVERQERAIARHYRGTASRAKRYLIITIPPEPAAG